MSRLRPSHARQACSWHFVAAAPPREVYAVMEQLVGVPPFRYQVEDDGAIAIEYRRKGLFGQWSRRTPRRRWVRCTARDAEIGTEVVVTASRGRGAVSRGLQLVVLLSAGAGDRRTIYRSRRIAPGPVTLVASWAGTGYQLFSEPAHGATRTITVHTATPLEAVSQRGAFVEVRLPAGEGGWVELDQIVSAPSESTRRAQEASASVG